MHIETVPLESWPGPKARVRHNSPFRASFTDTEDLLHRELRHLGARNTTLQVDADRSQFRVDGSLRANAKLNGPGVILSFTSKHGEQSFPCDKFLRWQDNLRAIALGAGGVAEGRSLRHHQQRPAVSGVGEAGGHGRPEGDGQQQRQDDLRRGAGVDRRYGRQGSHGDDSKRQGGA